MSTALWIAHVEVTDAEAYGEYAKRATDAIAAHGGVFLCRAPGGMSSLKGATARATSWRASPRSMPPWPATTRPPIRRR